MIYAVIDTNILVSSLLTKNDDASTAKVMDNIFEGTVTPLYSEDILQEYKAVLEREKFNFDQEKVDYILSAIKKFGEAVEENHYQMVLPDMDDVKFYAAAISRASASTFLVTGNIRHFPDEEFVVTPNEFVEILNNLK